jgi:hypothetical protein
MHPLTHFLKVFGWDIYDLGYMVQQLICQALFASGRTREVMDFLQVHENRLDEENEARKADLGWLGGQWLDLKNGYCMFDSYL